MSHFRQPRQKLGQASMSHFRQPRQKLGQASMSHFRQPRQKLSKAQTAALVTTCYAITAHVQHSTRTAEFFPDYTQQPF